MLHATIYGELLELSVGQVSTFRDNSNCVQKKYIMKLGTFTVN